MKATKYMNRISKMRNIQFKHCLMYVYPAEANIYVSVDMVYYMYIYIYTWPKSLYTSNTVGT